MKDRAAQSIEIATVVDELDISGGTKKSLRLRTTNRMLRDYSWDSP